jgi:hypothetical protein
MSIEDRAPGTSTRAASVASVERLGALTRLLSYARDEANELEADVLAYCLDVALAAVVDSLKEHAGGPTLGADVRDAVETARRH